MQALPEAEGGFLRFLIRRRLSGCPGADPEGVLQDLWTALLEDGGRRLRNRDPARPLRPYLAAIALNLCRDHLASLSRRAPHPPADPEDRHPLDGLIAREALDALSVRERLAWRLVEAEGWSYAQAGRVLGLSEGGVGALLTRIRKRLKGTPPP